MRRFILGLVVGVLLTALPAGAQYVRFAVTASDPVISFDQDAFIRFVGPIAKARGLTTQAQWNSAVNTVTAAGSNPGVNSNLLGLLEALLRCVRFDAPGS